MPTAKPTPQEASNILILGILGFVLCQVFGVMAWVRGNDYLARCKAAGIAPDREAVAGRLLGMASVIILVALIATLVAALAAYVYLVV